jgi:hypothetical protein
MREKLEHDLRGLVPDGEPTSTDLQDRTERARAAFEEGLRELAAFAHLVEGGHRLKAAVAQSSDGLRERLDEESSRREALERSLRESMADQQQALDAFRRCFEERTAELESRLASLSSSSTQPPVETMLSEDEVWGATKTAHEAQRAETIRLGGIVKVPELTDAVCRSIHGLNRSRFHELLKKWQGDDRLVLQVCNDPRLEPRADEGIESPRGLLYYVKLL